MPVPSADKKSLSHRLRWLAVGAGVSLLAACGPEPDEAKVVAYAEASLALAKVYAAKGRSEEAAAHYEEVLRGKPIVDRRDHEAARR